MDDGVQGRTGREERRGFDRAWWRRAVPIWLAAVGGTFAAARLFGSVIYLLDGGAKDGLNLLQRREEVRGWFAGDAVYEALPTAVYPPGSLTLLWPLVGPWSDGGTFAVYLALTAVCVVALTWGLRRGSGAWAWALWLLGASALQGGILVGQLHLLTLVAGCAAGLLAWRGRDDAGWTGADAVAGVLLAVAWIKPSSGLLFGAACLAWRWRALGVAGALHVLATLLAVAVRDESPVRLFEQWWFRAAEGARFGAAHGGYGSIHDVVGAVHLGQLAGFATGAVLVAATVWTWLHRRVDPWIVLGVLGIASRFAMYHRSYDDLLLLPAVVAAARLAGRADLPPLAVHLGVAPLAAVAALWGTGVLWLWEVPTLVITAGAALLGVLVVAAAAERGGGPRGASSG